MSLGHILAADPSVSTQAEIWTRFILQILATFGSAAVAIYTVFRKTGGITQRVETAAEAAKKAARLAEPTGNGFARDVLNSQEQILVSIREIREAQLEDRKTLTRHLEHHVEQGK